MLNIIILVLLIFGFLIGLKRGLIMQVLHLTGFIVAFIVAVLYFRQVAVWVEIWVPYPNFSDDSFWGAVLNASFLEYGFYHGLAFFLIFAVVKILMQILANLLDFVANLPILHSVNNILGAVLGFIEMYLIIFIFLFVLSIVQIDFIQDLIQNSGIASFMIESTPILSEQLKTRFFPG